ncbi:hypothetical protein HU200_061388 [Digitaria exilis]|uniref:Uncharacterized protein n=1 Tax=Digitaria exilis TaxID=1010633 RepID=A0A835E0S3_9POAL|nr:hypothetical protein HU200_061388 [Digitaria exilis]
MHLDSYNCVRCVENVEETIASSCFLECLCSQAFWIFMGVHWDLINLQPYDMIAEVCQNFGSTLFREIIIVAT